MKTVLFALLALTGAVCSAAELERVVIVPAHPDDLIACLGFCHLARGKYEVHVVDFTHGERGCGEEKFKHIQKGLTLLSQQPSPSTAPPPLPR